MMPHPIHEPVVKAARQAIDLMDEFMRNRIDQTTYYNRLKALEVNSLLERHQDDFKHNPQLVHYLDALMILSSLQHEMDFQVAEYGANVASEDIRMLQELLQKFSTG